VGVDVSWLMRVPFLARKHKYSDHLDTLVALITHLAYSQYVVRSSPALAKVLSIEESEIIYTLENFKSLFARTSKLSAHTGAPLYGLHVRRAIAWAAGVEEDETTERPKLETPFVNGLIDFVVKKADQETRHSLAYGTALAAIIGSVLVAVLTITSK